MYKQQKTKQLNKFSTRIAIHFQLFPFIASANITPCHTFVHSTLFILFIGMSDCGDNDAEH